MRGSTRGSTRVRVADLLLFLEPFEKPLAVVDLDRFEPFALVQHLGLDQRPGKCVCVCVFSSG